MLRALVTNKIAVLGLTIGLSFCIAGSASASAAPTLAHQERQGEGIAESVRSGEKQCSDLSADEFELIGEYAMGHYLGSEATHSVMNRRMTSVMGEAGERRMHVALGYRYSGCSGGPTSGWVVTMADMMGGVGGVGGYGSSMMGGGEYEGRDSYSGTMMGGRRHGDSGIGTLGVVLIALAAAAIGAGGVALLMQQRQPREGAAP